MSLSSASREYADRCAISRWSFCSMSSLLSSTTSSIPSNPFMGVRSSCDIFARNSLFAWLEARAVRMAVSKSSVRCRMRSSSSSRFCRISSRDRPNSSIMRLKLSPKYWISSRVVLTWIGSNFPCRTEVIPCCNKASGRARTLMVKRDINAAVATTTAHSNIAFAISKA